MTEMSMDMLRVYYAKNPILDGLESAMRALGATSPRVAELMLSTSPVGAHLTAREAQALLSRWYEPCEYCGRLLRWLAPPASVQDRMHYAPGYWRHVSLDVEVGEALHPWEVPSRPLLGDRWQPMHGNEERCTCAPPTDYARAAAPYHCAALGQDQPVPLSVEVTVAARAEDALRLIREQAADGVARAEGALYRVIGIKNYPEALKIAVRTLDTIAAGKPAMHPEPEPEHPEPAGQLPDPVVTEYPEPGGIEGVEHPA